MPEHDGEMPAEAEADREAEDAKQCRICLDGEDPELGRLIRPCLCRGSITVCFLDLHAEHVLTWSCWPVVRSCEVLAAVAEHLEFPERILRLSAMRIPLPLRSYSHYGDCNKPR